MTHAPRLGLLLLALAPACDPPTDVPGPALADDAAPGADAPIAAAPAIRACDVAAPADVAAIVATAGGLALAVPDGPDGPLLVHRARGRACDLVDDARLVAASALLDADDRGNLYVFPADPGPTDALATMLPDAFRDNIVARVTPDDRVEKHLEAGRGVWSFGVAPAGDALWVSSCGPSGIFTLAVDGLREAMPAPDTLWAQYPAVLTDARSFWSIGVRTCDPAAALTADCGHALVRTTPAGSEDLVSTVADLGAGLESPALARCGPHICGLYSAGAVVWDVDATVLRTLTPADGEHLVQITGNADGVYLLLDGDAGARVTFLPHP